LCDEVGVGSVFGREKTAHPIKRCAAVGFFCTKKDNAGSLETAPTALSDRLLFLHEVRPATVAAAGCN